MSKNKKKPTKENLEMEKSNEVLTEVKNKPSKEEKAKLKEAKAREKAKAQKKAMKEAKPKRHRVKEVFSELKKVNWPSFKKACKQTGTVLVVVAVFMLVILGIDYLLSLLMNLLIVK